MVAYLKRITYIIIFIPCMRSVLCVDGLEGKNLRASWFIIFSLLLFCTTAFQRCRAKYWLGFCWNHTSMHSYKPWLKNYSYVIAITHSLLSRHCSASYLYQCKCIVLYVQFFWDSIMKWRGFINNNKNNNNKKITVTFYVYVLLLKAVLKKTEVSGQKTLYYWMIIMDLPELYPEC